MYKVPGILLLALLISCSQNSMDGIEVYKQNEALVPLIPVELSEHTGFDTLDNFILANDANEQAMQIYEDISRLAPDNPLVLIRAAHGALTIDGSDLGPRLAASIIAKLKELPQENLAENLKYDLMFVDLMLVTRVLAENSPGEQLVITKASEPLAKDALEQNSAVALAKNWVGPHKATAQSAKDMIVAIQSAIDRWDESKSDG